MHRRTGLFLLLPFGPNILKCFPNISKVELLYIVFSSDAYIEYFAFACVNKWDAKLQNKYILK